MGRDPFALERPIHDLLDDHHVPFRLTVAQIEASYGLLDSDRDHVVLTTATPLISLLPELRVDRSHRAVHSNFLFGQLRLAFDDQQAFERAVHEFSNRFGEPRFFSFMPRYGGSAEWEFGTASLQISNFSDGGNFGGPDRSTEVHITHNWLPMPNETELAALNQYVEYRGDLSYSFRKPRLESRWFDAGAAGHRRGLGFDQDMTHMICIGRDAHIRARDSHVLVVPVEQLSTVRIAYHADIREKWRSCSIHWQSPSGGGGSLGLHEGSLPLDELVERARQFAELVDIELIVDEP